MNIPIIGVTPLWDENLDSLWMLPGYFDGIARAGGLPVMLPLTADKDIIRQISQTVSGLLFTGGHDVAPGLYGEDVDVNSGPFCPERDETEASLFFEAIIGMNKPALGICRGMQFINVLLGGTLYQDLPSQFNGSVPIEHRQASPKDIPSHTVSISRSSPLFTLLGSERAEVNSSHHQGVHELSPELECMAAADDGLIEAVFMRSRKFVWAVQWHPEIQLNDIESRRLFEAFIGACRQAQ